MPPAITPMHPPLVAKPFHHEGWVYEEKVDGWRMLAHEVGGTVKLVSRNGLDHTRRFPGLVAALRKLDANGLILDGEVAVYDAQLVSRFEWLRHASPPDLSTPPLFMVFDCLQVRGKDLRKEPLYVRRNVIEDVLDEQDMVLPVRRHSASTAVGRVVAKGRRGVPRGWSWLSELCRPFGQSLMAEPLATGRN